MDVQIKAVIIHEIAKKEGETDADLTLTDKVLDGENLQIRKIVSSLDASFSKRSPSRARFSNDGFKSEIPDFEKIDLIKSSKNLSRSFKVGIQNVHSAKGGYLVFCQYKTARNYFSVFLVRNAEGSFLERKAKSQEWDIKSVRHLDIKHFAMGMRINLDLLNSNYRYIQLVKGTTDISKYFENWIGLDPNSKKQEAEDGKALYKVFEEIDLPDGITDREELKRMVYNHIRSHPSKIVNLPNLSEYLFGDRDKIPGHCDKKEVDINPEFKMPKKQLDRFHKVTAMAEGITLDAPRSKFSPSGIFIPESGDSVIIRSKKLADDIKKKLQPKE